MKINKCKDAASTICRRYIYIFFYSSRHIMADEALPLCTVKEKEKNLHSAIKKNPARTCCARV